MQILKKAYKSDQICFSRTGGNDHKIHKTLQTAVFRNFAVQLLNQNDYHSVTIS